MYIKITFFADDTAQIVECDSEGLKSRKTTRALRAVFWMSTQEKTWKWYKDDEGNKVAIWEKELAE